MISNILIIGSLNNQTLVYTSNVESCFVARRTSQWTWLLIEILENELELTWSLYCIFGKGKSAREKHIYRLLNIQIRGL